MSKPGFFFYLILLLLALGSFFAWYFFNSNSPYHERTTYLFWFPEVGSLRSGDPVTLNGPEVGKVGQLRLHNDGVLVQVAILATYEISADARVIVQNTGLMGERCVAIYQGRSAENLTPGIIRSGSFDAGATKMVIQVGELLGSLDTLLEQFRTTAHDLFLDGETLRKFGKLGRSLAQLGRNAELIYGDSRSALQGIRMESMQLADSVEQVGQRLLGVWSEISANLGALETSSDTLNHTFRELKNAIDATLLAFKGDQGSLGLILRDPEFLEIVSNITQNGEDILAVMRKRGLRMNIDIF
jgi:ABC-type transporter Mla subunit MlaD